MLIFRSREAILDRRGAYRSPVTMPGYRKGKPAANKGRTFPPEPLKTREVLALIDACGRGPCGIRNQAMIAVLWRAGLRCSEMLALGTRDVDLEEGSVYVRHGKGDRHRTVAIDPYAYPYIRAWLRARSELGIRRGPLFCVVKGPTRGEGIHSVYVRNLLKQLADRAGIEARVHPHGLRHTHAFELMAEHMDLRLIRQQLGHSNISVTARYVEHLNPTDLREAIHNRPPPAETVPIPSAA